jgi:hypothetical protein
MPEFSAEHLDLFFGDVSQAVCRVYARYSESPGAAGTQLSGTLTGPTCAYSATLPATSKLVDRGPGGPPLAEAVVPEPCFWTPEMPHWYQARVQLQQDGKVVLETERMLGIRPLGAAATQLRFDAKRWVLRGVSAQEPTPESLAEAHSGNTALVVANPSDAVCEAASRIGVLLVAELERPELTDLRRLNRWPAVGIVSLPTGAVPQLNGLGHNLLLAERFAAGQRMAPSLWADLAICDVTGQGGLEIGPLSIPVIARRALPSWPSLDDARGGCDRLQSDLAHVGQFAGYIV